MNRVIRERIRVNPILGPDGPVPDLVGTRFCVCRNDDGSPKSKLSDCRVPPFHCIPNGAFFTWPEAPSAPTLGEAHTTWHRMEVSATPACASPKGCLDSSFPVTYPGPELQLGFWHYVEDNTRWLNSGYFAPIPPTPGFPPGTDLAGILWAHGATDAGASAHDLVPGGCIPPTVCPSTIADDYAIGVAPDWKNTFVMTAQVPTVIELELAYCPGCGDVSNPTFPGEQLFQPLPVGEEHRSDNFGERVLVGRRRALLRG